MWVFCHWKILENMNEAADKGEKRLHILGAHLVLEQEQMHTVKKQGNAVTPTAVMCLHLNYEVGFEN